MKIDECLFKSKRREGVDSSTIKFKGGTSLTIVFREQWLSEQHLCEDAPHTPQVQRQVITMIKEHDLGSPIVTCGDIASVCHVRVSDAGQTKVTDLQIAGFVDQDVAGLEISVKNPSGVDVLEEEKKEKKEKHQRKRI